MKKNTNQSLSGHPLSGLSICFDLDGTLIDTAPDLVRVTNEVIAKRGHGPVNYKQARKAVGYGSRRMITDALSGANDKASQAEIDMMQVDFLDRYAKSIDQLSKPFPRVETTLVELRNLGAELSVCTNKPGWLARPLIEKLGLTDYFIRIVGSDDVPNKKPHAGHIFAAAGHRDAAKIIMVGDSRPDLGAAKNAGALSVMMDYGYSPEPARGMGADITLSQFRDLPAAVIKAII